MQEDRAVERLDNRFAFRSGPKDDRPHLRRFPFELQLNFLFSGCGEINFTQVDIAKPVGRPGGFEFGGDTVRADVGRSGTLALGQAIDQFHPVFARASGVIVPTMRRAVGGGLEQNSAVRELRLVAKRILLRLDLSPPVAVGHNSLFGDAELKVDQFVALGKGNVGDVIQRLSVGRHGQ